VTPYPSAAQAVAIKCGIGCATEMVELMDHLDDDVIHPGDTFGKAFWWLFELHPQAAIDACASFVRALARDAYGFDSVLRAVLKGLPQALPPHADQSQYSAIHDRIFEQARYR
jgi:hypothetical protein